MQDLRLVGVHEDGQHLLLAAGDGARFRLPLDDALRAAARRDRPRLGQLQIELDGGLRPREVQALIRSGLSAEEVADRAGWSVEKVRRYEGPVLAEREHVTDLARGVRMRSHGRGSDSESLAIRVAHRLTGRGVDPATASWDAARDVEGRWSVLVLFSAGGRERTATWLFDVPARTVTARDDEARWLSEDDSDQSGPIPSPHQPSLSSAPTTVYDVESDGGVAAPRARRRPQDPIDLMAAMRETSRSRRPRRRVHQPTLTPVDEDPREDAVPLEPVHHDPEGDQLPPAARGTHPLDAAPSDATDPVADSPGVPATDPAGPEPTGPSSDGAGLPEDELLAAAASDGPTLLDVPDAGPKAAESEPAAADDDVDEPADAEPAATTRAIRSVRAVPDDDTSSDATSESDVGEHTASGRTGGGSKPDTGTPSEAAGHSRPRRGGRPSVPRWDDIMFGAKSPVAERTDD